MIDLRSAFVALLAAPLIVVVGCTTTTDDTSADDTAEDEGALTGARSVALKYEGTCEFLRGCSSYSKNLPKGQVTWGCTGVGACDDDGLWVAGPTKSYCKKSVRICKGTRCTNATVKDISVSRDWEASNGVLDALGLPHGLNGKCSGFGGGKVTVEVGGTAPSKPGSDAPGDTSPSDADGCYSSTLSRDVAELVCVQSRSSSVWFQCKSGKWHRGVEGAGEKGPYGDCADRFPL